MGVVMTSAQSDEPAVPVALLDSYVPVPALMTTLLLFDGRHENNSSKTFTNNYNQQ